MVEWLSARHVQARVYCVTVPCRAALRDLASWSVSVFGSSLSEASGRSRITHIWGLWSETPPYGKYKCNHECDLQLNDNPQRLVVSHTFSRQFLSEDAEAAKLYRTAPVPVMRSDILRLLVLWQRGGWYADFDVQPLTSWDRMRRPDASVVVFTELGSQRHVNATRPPCGSRHERARYRHRIAFDAFFVDRPRHPFIGHTLALLKQRAAQGRPHRGRSLPFHQASTDCDVFWFTGPDLFTVSVHTYMATSPAGVHIHDEHATARLIDLGKMGDYGGRRSGQRRHTSREHSGGVSCAPCRAAVEARMEQLALAAELAGLLVGGVMLARLAFRTRCGAAATVRDGV